ncbi:Hypothetical predicted protein [Marmota monax]|uniref:Uncharacterized protein n=1 Tax=Marmota monax TaxID=9995 RepID=A0A5E4CZQ9_MARMO|nr:Hypothetical predicted protein [Marmota monax]
MGSLCGLGLRTTLFRTVGRVCPRVKCPVCRARLRRPVDVERQVPHSGSPGDTGTPSSGPVLGPTTTWNSPPVTTGGSFGYRTECRGREGGSGVGPETGPPGDNHSYGPLRPVVDPVVVTREDTGRSLDDGSVTGAFRSPDSMLSVNVGPDGPTPPGTDTSSKDDPGSDPVLSLHDWTPCSSVGRDPETRRTRTREGPLEDQGGDRDTRYKTRLPLSTGPIPRYVPYGRPEWVRVASRVATGDRRTWVWTPATVNHSGADE